MAKFGDKKVFGNAVSDLDTAVQILRDGLAEREDWFYERSEEWQFSEAGEDFEMRTSDLESQIDDIEYSIDQFNEILTEVV